MIVLAVFVLCVYMFVYKNTGQEQGDNKTLQNAGLKETSEDLFYKNSRPVYLDIEIGSKKYYVDCSSFCPYFPIYNIDEYMLYYDFGKTIAAKKCVVKIGDIYCGSKYKDTCISEMFFLLQRINDFIIFICSKNLRLSSLYFVV